MLPRSTSEALELHERALDVCTKADDIHGQMRCEIDIGIACSRLGDSHRAEEAYTRALARGRDAHSPDLAAIASLNLGVVCRGAKHHAAASEMLHGREDDWFVGREMLETLAIRLDVGAGDAPLVVKGVTCQ